jgi:hypothetical protein
MVDSSISPARTIDTKLPWPKLSLVVSGLLWLIAWEAIVWFVPSHPRWVIRNPADGEEGFSQYLMGFSPDSKALVTAADLDPNMPGQFYRLWDVNTGEDLGTIGRKDKTILPNVVYASQKSLTREILFQSNRT